MPQLSHSEIWLAIDRVAAQRGITPSALARLAGLDPTSFNRSKRMASDGHAGRPRWPSTESLAKVLAVTGVSFTDFAALAEGEHRTPASLPMVSQRRAADVGVFDPAGLPAGPAWEEIEFPGAAPLYAMEITGDAMAPALRDGDRIVVCPQAEARRGDRVVVRTRGGEVLVRELARITARQVELACLNPAFEDSVLDRDQIEWMARILWVSQ